ncbi:SH2 domain-containing adapter protein E isoform X1 [Nothobranchius furzeri]|uniref:Src homology 2 domain containing E n=4 Tax=Nothobranchius TaxID=28779 RepID=A0A1A8ARH3_NOTFU|nr:transcript variant X1 [Nothobranchius furzeri]
MELKGVRPSKEIYWFIWDKMPKWFKEFPIALKHDTDKICSASESDSQPNGSKTGQRKNSSVDGTGGSGGAGSLLSGKNQKNSGRMSVISQKDKKVWDSLLKSYKNSRTESTFEEQHRPLKASSSACSYISMIRVDKQDKKPNFNNGTMTVLVPEAEKTTPCKTEIMRILEDYADPFDAPRTREQRDVERLGENDGYMEPYDAQQMITEIRRRGSKDLLKGSALTDRSRGTFEKGHSGSIRIYDLPYEGGGDNKRTEVTRPELDRRPATEYELPWEQSKEHIVRTLSAQFDNPVRDETLQEHLKQKSRTQNILRSSPALLPYLSNPESEICCINPSLPLEKQSWYHGCVTRQEAEFQLQSCREASFLVRNSEPDNNKYSIALKTTQGCVHTIVAQTKENSFLLDQSSCVFPSIPQVVYHCRTQRLPFPGAQHTTLLHPVPRCIH